MKISPPTSMEHKTYPASGKIKFLQFPENECIDECEVCELVKSIAAKNLKPFQVPDGVKASTELRLDSGETKVSELLKKG